jgi:putative copper resistance protein D
MPGFEAVLPAEERWDLVNFLRALADADRARLLADVTSADPWLVAPDFAFSVGPTPARTLKEYRGRPVLLVLFTLPASRPRLDQLSHAHDTLRGLGAEVIAVPADDAAGIIGRLGAAPPKLFPVVTEGAVDIAQAYGLFRRAPTPDGLLPDPPIPPHMEFLIDRQGYIRARFLGSTGGALGLEVTALSAEIQRLNQERPIAPPPPEHVH